MGVAWATSTPRKITTPPGLRHARTCYDHLAGEVAVRLFDRLVSRQWLTPDGETLTSLGQEKLAQMGIVLAASASRRKLTCGCLDWSEREYHIAGSIGKATAEFLLNNKWIERHGKSRGIRLTELGEKQMRELWDGGEIIENYKSKMII